MSEVKKVTFVDENDRRALGYRQFEDFADVVFQHVELAPEPDPKGEENSVFDLIFSVNPLTRLPDGDIAMFMNENTSPEVRQFISQNLQVENPDQLALPSISDKDLDAFGGVDGFENFRRGYGESINSYRDRVINFLKDLNNSEGD